MQGCIGIDQFILCSGFSVCLLGFKVKGLGLGFEFQDLGFIVDRDA